MFKPMNISIILFLASTCISNVLAMTDVITVLEPIETTGISVDSTAFYQLGREKAEIYRMTLSQISEAEMKQFIVFQGKEAILIGIIQTLTREDATSEAYLKASTDYVAYNRGLYEKLKHIDAQALQEARLAQVKTKLEGVQACMNYASYVNCFLHAQEIATSAMPDIKASIKAFAERLDVIQKAALEALA